MPNTTIPVVDLGAAQPQISSIRDLGFLAVKAAGNPSQAQVDELFAITRNFFENETSDNKEAAAITVENKGWVRIRQEVLDVDGNPGGDIKEAFNLAKFTGGGDPCQVLPPLLLDRKEALSQFMKSCHALCMRLLESFAIDMGLEENYFTSRHDYSEPQGTILRLLYYPPVSASTHESGPTGNSDIRAGAHSDYGTCTLLFQKDIGGLQILLPPTSPGAAPSWIEAPVLNDGVLVNIGDTFDFWTGGRFPSTQHRVVAPRTAEESQSRFSIAYFLHPADSERLARMPNIAAGIDASEHDRSVITRFGVTPDEQLTAKEWLSRRLAATYGARKEA